MGRKATLYMVMDGQYAINARDAGSYERPCAAQLRPLGGFVRKEIIMSAWLTIQNEKITCNYCGASVPFYLHLIAKFSGQHYKCAAQHSVEPTFDNVGEKPTVSKSYPNELPA
jgi:hypothetical protein